MIDQLALTSVQRAEADRLLAMTPAEHLRAAACVMAAPDLWVHPYAEALVHLGMAQVKQGTRGD